MDLFLMAAISWQDAANMAWWILTVAVGLGFVIFVHELGHFLVAKACGVKCEKFYIGFDIPISIGRLRLPSRFGRVQWGETEYGIGILPLGGYVKMLGQDDNPANTAREAERSRLPKAEPDASGAAADAADEPPQWDPRSYPAKPVLLRMAIISAGVIMNLVFAVVFATFAFSAGVPYTPCEIGGTLPGSPAWIAGLEPGSRIVQIGDGDSASEHLRFDWDLRNAVAMAGGNEDVALLVRQRDGSDRSVSLRPKVTMVDGTEVPMLGIEPPITTRFSAKQPAAERSPAEKAQPPLKESDRVVAVNGRSVQDGYQLAAALAAADSGPLQLTVERELDKGDAAQPQTLTVTVPPNHAKRIGLVMTGGAISGVRPKSPAARAGFREGDVLVSFNGKPIGDPLTLAHRVQVWCGKEVEVVVRRGGPADKDRQEQTLRVTPDPPESYENVFTIGSPMSVRSLGIVFPVLPRVVDVVRNSPAERAGMRPDDEVVSVAFTSTDPKRKTRELIYEGRPMDLSEHTFTWPFIYDRMQSLEPDEQLVLNYRRGGRELSATVKPVTTDEPYADRGLRLTALSETRRADSWREAVVLGFQRTGEDMARVVGFLLKLFSGSISPKNLGGPISIAAVAGSEASQGIARLLIFLTFLSANLAILNFLPIPALDGGHMVFLLAEGIRGKPVDERMQIALTLAGVACLLGLMIFVFALDIGRFFL